MIILISGGSGSGKSAYAEDYITALSQGGSKYYLATMQILDEEGHTKAARHRMLRKGKGFVTIEQPKDIHLALGKMAAGQGPDGPKPRTALLECMSNLVANEMFSEETRKSRAEVTDKILFEIGLLGAGLEHLVIVTNNVFEDGVSYHESTMEYMEAMGQVNEKLAAMADEVTEVVVGIPIRLKEGN